MTLQILLGDDEPLVRRGLIRYCRNLAEFTEVETAEALVKEARKNKYGLIITDNNYLLGLTGREEIVTGIEAVAKIREFDKETPIILQSGDIGGKEESAYSAGATYVFNKLDLIGKIKGILEDLNNSNI